MFKQTIIENEAATGRLPMVLSYPLDIPTNGPAKRKFDNDVAELGARTSSFKKE